MMTNLLEETEHVMQDQMLTWEDVVHIGSADGHYRLSTHHFKKISDTEYDAGFGAQEVASDLIIVFVDGTQMVRHEYDGAEGWEVLKPFRHDPDSVVDVHDTVIGRLWSDMADLPLVQHRIDRQAAQLGI